MSDYYKREDIPDDLIQFFEEVVPPPCPCVVLDPFNGSGATGECALLLGRRYLGVDLSREYLLDHAVERCERGSRPHKGEALAVPRRRKPLPSQASFL